MLEHGKKILVANLHPSPLLKHDVPQTGKNWNVYGRTYSDKFKTYRPLYTIEIPTDAVTSKLNLFKLSSKELQNQLIDNVKVNKNRIAYDIFVNDNLHNPEFQGKYVVFVNEELYDIANNEVELVKKVHDRYGNINMYVGKVSYEKTQGMIESPEI